MDPDVAAMVLYKKQLGVVCDRLPIGWMLSKREEEIPLSLVYCEPWLIDAAARRDSDEARRRSSSSGPRTWIGSRQSATPELNAVEPLPLYRVLAQSRSVACIGDLGVGKSVLARHVVSSFLSRPSELDIPADYTPVLLELRDTGRPDLSLEKEVARRAASLVPLDQQERLAFIVERDIAYGRALVVLDGVDEYRGIPDWLSSGIQRLAASGNIIVVTSRPSVSGELGLHLKRVWLADIDLDEEHYFERWAAALEPNMDAPALADGIRAGLEQNPVRSVVQGSRLLAALLVVIATSEARESSEKVSEKVTAELRSPTRIYGRFIGQLIAWELGRNGQAYRNLSRDDLRAAFGVAGLEVQLYDTGRGSAATRGSVARHLHVTRSVSAATADRLVEFWFAAGVLDERQGFDDAMVFRHEGFREYAAAVGIMDLGGYAPSAVEKVGGPRNPDWRATRLHVAALAARPMK